MATKIVYTPLLKEFSEDKFGISRKIINTTLEKPSCRYDTSLDELNLGFYLKKHQDNTGTFYILISTRMSDISTRNIDLALLIPDDLVDIIDTNRPIVILQKFAFRFGMAIMIGDITSKFVFKQSIPLGPGFYDPSKIVGVDNPSGHSFALQTFLKLDDSGDQLTAKCALAYCIDTDEYIAYLAQRRA